MARRYGMVLVLLTTLLNVPIAEAGPIVYFDSYRSLSSNGEFFENTTTGRWSAIAANASNGNAHQSSNISQSGINGTGAVSGNSNTPGTFSLDKSTRLFTSFQIDAPYSASLNFSLQASEEFGDVAYTEGYLYDQNTQTKLAQVMLESGFARLLYEGVLEPGLYSLFLMSEVSAPAGLYFGHAFFNGELALEPFTPVPEPATLTLFGVGLAATAWRRRRRQ